jgi:hypothetical protein
MKQWLQAIAFNSRLRSGAYRMMQDDDRDDAVDGRHALEYCKSAIHKYR